MHTEVIGSGPSLRRVVLRTTPVGADIGLSLEVIAVDGSFVSREVGVGGKANLVLGALFAVTSKWFGSTIKVFPELDQNYGRIYIR